MQKPLSHTRWVQLRPPAAFGGGHSQAPRAAGGLGIGVLGTRKGVCVASLESVTPFLFPDRIPLAYPFRVDPMLAPGAVLKALSQSVHLTF